MKQTIIAGSFLLLLCSCSLASKFQQLKPKNIGSYEITSNFYVYEVEVFQLNLYDKKGKVKDSAKFYFDIENKKLKRFDRNGNLIISTKNFPTQKLPKYYTPNIREI